MNILLTGGASGIGLSVINKFKENNHNIIALDINEIDENPNVKTFICDITNDESLQKVETYIKENNIKLDLIINIAGIHKMASLVESPFVDIKKVIDINLNGTMLVNHTFHKYLKDKGTIIITTSEVASIPPLPFNGIYSVSKIALESYAQALRQELNLLNQKVITIQPGAIETPLSRNSLTDTKSLSVKTKLYQKQAHKFLEITTKFMGTPMNSDKLARKIYKICLKKHPKYTYKIHHNIGLVLLGILPKRWQCSIIKLLLNT